MSVKGWGPLGTYLEAADHTVSQTIGARDSSLPWDWLMLRGVGTRIPLGVFLLDTTDPCKSHRVAPTEHPFL